MLPPLLTDANITVDIVRFLRLQGVDIVSACEEGWRLYCHQKRPHSALGYLAPMEFQQQNLS